MANEFEDQERAIERTLIVPIYFIKILKTIQSLRIKRRNWHNVPGRYANLHVLWSRANLMVVDAHESRSIGLVVIDIARFSNNGTGWIVCHQDGPDQLW
jgi:hypothetical protein